MYLVNMNSMQPDVKNACEKMNTCSGRSAEKVTLLAPAKATPSIHSETKGCIADIPLLSPFYAMLEDSEGLSGCLESEGRKLTIEEISEMGDDCLGLRVLLTTKQGSCLGVINIILAARRKILLEKVSDPQTGKKKLGLRTYFFHEVLNVKVLGEDQEARQRLLKGVCFEKQQGKKLLRKKLLPIDLQEKCYNNIPKEEVVPGLIKQLVYEEASKDKSTLSPTPPPPPPPGRLPRPSKWVIIDGIDDAYQKALSLICKEMVISVGMTGLQLGRAGTLVWLTVATSNIIFHFDVVKIGPSEVMKGGLGAVLQDGAVVKVVHDCRAMEDFLHHQLNLNLRNVFDTQAAEIYLHLVNHKGAVPLLVSTLASLLTKYLNLSPHHLFPHGQENSKIDEFMWLERPLAEPLGERLARDIMFLRELRLEQLNMMLVDLRQVTEVYLGAVRDKDSLTVSKLEPQIVPAELQRLGRQSPLKILEGDVPFIQYSKGLPRPRSWRK